jgi:site-specific DNA-methyltransferase (adenine-specific)
MNWTDKIQVYNEDCMETMARYDDNFFDLAIVDPPYGIDINSSGRLGHYGGKGKTWDSKKPSNFYFIELSRISKNQIIWGGNYFNLPATRCFLIWDKQQPEDVSFASCEFAWTSFNLSAKTFYKRPQKADKIRIHPTQKPVALYNWILKNYAKPNDIILDTHLGSGSNAIACHYYGCSLVAAELDTEYYKASLKRFKQQTAQIKLF